MKQLSVFFTVLLFFPLYTGCTTRSESTIVEAENYEKTEPLLPSGYKILSEIHYDTDKDNLEEIVLFGFKDKNILLIVFDLSYQGHWEKHILTNSWLHFLDQNKMQNLVCVVRHDWIGWGPPNSEPYEVFIWDGITYSEPDFLM
ncbi:MAG: hypothetical protein JW822_08565 [Spirochaetales bacterium]|nr:hypothetical protein [Spirochaetales bacterium]